MLNRAWSVLDIKSVDSEERVITGVASTPTPDRGGDVMIPEGAQFSLPMPLLWQHRSDQPIGEVFEAEVRSSGIVIKARLPKIDEPGPVRDRVETAWQSIKSKPPLIRGLSIGWSPIESESLGNGLTKFVKWVWAELSAVTIPMNSEANILTVKAADLASYQNPTPNQSCTWSAGKSVNLVSVVNHNLETTGTITAGKAVSLAASGRHSPGASGLPVVTALKDAPRMKTTQEQIKDFEATLLAKTNKMSELMTTAGETGVTLDQAQAEEYDTLKSECKSVEQHLSRLRDLETLNLSQARAINATTGTNLERASEARGGTSVISVKANVPKGTAFTRYVMAKVVGKNSISDAIMHVKSNKVWMDQTPEVLTMLEQKAVVNWGTIAEPAWAAPLAVTQPINEFLDLLRPATLIGKITGLRQVPFNISMPAQTSGGTYGWVGEGAPKPVGQLQLATVTLGIAKAAGIIVISEELARLSTPSAEGVVRNDMVQGMAQFLDLQFIDPTVAAVTNVSPASITNLSNGFGSAGTSNDNARTDIKTAIGLLTASNYNIAETTFIMSQKNAFILSTAITSTGVRLFPDVTPLGGSLLGIPVVTSQSAGNVVALVHTPSILFADEGGVNIDVSREAAVEMNTVPTSPVTASSVLVSLWQNNLIGLRAERFINWKRARTTSVVYTTQAYV